MHANNKVVWSEGMFLRVQHFQQADRYTEALIKARTEHLRPFPWGISELSINRELLATGKFALNSCTGVMPDGTPFSIPDDCDHPPPLELFDTARGSIIYLTLPARQPGHAEIGQMDREDAGTRFSPIDCAVTDANLGTEQRGTLRVGRLRLRYQLDSAPLGGYERIGLARVVDVRADRSILLDDKYVAPALSIGAQPILTAYANELLGLISHRAEALAARVTDPSSKGSAEIADFLLLQALNRHEPVLRHAVGIALALHPEEFYRLCCAIAGEIATFTTEAKRASIFPDYRHEDLQSSFAPIFIDLRSSLSAVLEQTAVPIPLQDRRYGIKVGMIADRALLTNASFILVTRADMPIEHLRRMFPNQVKIGPVEEIAQLVNVALPGIGVRPLPVAPRQLPYRNGSVYFDLDRSNPHFKQLQKSGGIAIHLAGDFPQIEMELWAIKG
jgi:type VI secretion system protein ImpJ